MKALNRRDEPYLGASLLAVEDPTQYSDQAILAVKAGVDMIHFDVAGPHEGQATAILQSDSDDTSQTMTPESLGKIKVAAEAEGLAVPVDVHIMNMEPTREFIEPYIHAGADYITIHWEAFKEKDTLHQCLFTIKSLGVNAGIAMRPDVALAEVITFTLDNSKLIDHLSLAGVYPCLGGQTMVYDILNNLRALHALRCDNDLPFHIMVDGGIEPEVSGRKCFWAGADVLVAGSSIFGGGRRDIATLRKAVQTLKDVSTIEEPNIYDAIAEMIVQIQVKKGRPPWILVEAFNGGGKTFTVEKQLVPRLRAFGLAPLIIGLDISWTDRSNRSRWREEAYAARKKGEDHNFFNALKQDPPMHWRKSHSDIALAIIDEIVRRAAQTGQPQEGIIETCYQFDEVGGTQGTQRFSIKGNSVILVEGVYASAVQKNDWDLKIFIEANHEAAKCRAMVRDEWKVHRPQDQTRALYDDVYEPTYREYIATHRPAETADIVIDARDVDEQMMPLNPRITSAKQHIVLLECTNEECLHQAPARRINACRKCGQDMNNIIVGDIDFLNEIVDDMPGMWRYHRLMPVNPEYIVTGGEGNTPIVYLPGISEMLDVHLWVKLEITNPTGTFKDREGAYVITNSRQYNQDNVVMQSTGNTAIAITYYAGLAKMYSWCFIPALCTYKLHMPPKKPNNYIIAVDGHPIDVKRTAVDFATLNNYPKISPFYERCEANATIAYEIVEQILKGELPRQDLLLNETFDWYVQTIAAGMGPIGFYIGMKRLETWTRGRVNVPRILATEISEFAPIQHAWDSGLKRVGEEVATPYFPDHELFEPTLWTTNIMKYYPYLRNILIDTNGMLTAVTPQRAFEIMGEYPIREELESLGYRLSDTERASFVGLSGLVEGTRNGKIQKGSRILLMLTGKGQKDQDVLENPDAIVDPLLHKPTDITRMV